ncbi:uncharacterized protein LOC116509713 isoform X2 [Thamnophis elegans]|uniref:uncharacterized protein LOC116509713 isoform X2 n=1 Tax=Thamnophis elegans TaxID=35005 RepID=UPI0013764D19|nr:uncharacterized protein LOC116509713 isoform X2 [Thamnophis elegans]
MRKVESYAAAQASRCTNDDIKLVVSFLDDRDKETKTETLNVLKAFSTIWKFQIKIQEYVPQIIETVTSNWDNNLQIAGLKLLNALHIPDHTHTLLRTQITNFMDILLTANTSTKIQVLKFLGSLMEKEDLLYDIMNCQAPADFLNLFQSSQPGNLLYEMLVFLERLSEGRQSPQYQSMQWDYNKNSLHEIIFGDNSRLSERLLALIVHLEEDVQTQACKVILSLKINKEESRISNGHSLGSEISAYPLESTRKSQIANGSLFNLSSIQTTESSSNAPQSEKGGSFYPPSSTNGTSGSFHLPQDTNETSGSFHLPQESEISAYPLESTIKSQIANASLFNLSSVPTTESSSNAPQSEKDGSFYPPSSTNGTSGSFHPLLGTNETSGSFHPLLGTNETSGSFHPLLGTNETSGSFHPLLGTNETSGSFHPLLGTNETGHSFYPLERADHSFQPLPNISVEGSEPVLEEPMDSFHTPPIESDNNI